MFTSTRAQPPGSSSMLWGYDAELVANYQSEIFQQVQI